MKKLLLIIEFSSANENTAARGDAFRDGAAARKFAQFVM
ncbi:hypothetical protein J2W52_003077 [Rhizobium miluonense]|uniref:Uncharacterized protein n=1 Tax=Rhizobium miluonense TaxID=411945 RepID=A0ABU1SSR2_9HYPH|nr:hypothetical protein [Rhizobium miluonense]